MATPEQVQALLNGPAMAPPPNTEPNFDDPKNLFKWFILTIALCVTFSTVAVAIRIYTKLRIIHSIGVEDYTSVLGYLMWISYCVPTTLIMKHGGGVHQWNVQLKTLIQLLYYSNIAAIVYGITVFIIKLSILLQYLRIFVPTRKSNFIYWGVHTVIVFNFSYYLAITFSEIFLCQPREKYWNVLLPTGHCNSANAANISAGAVNSVSDFVILLLPQGVIWKLQMPLKKKIGVSAIFLTGLFVCVTSVVRLYYAVRLAQTGDVSYNVALMGFWTYAELSAGVICGCLPVTPKFFHAVAQKLSTISGSSSAMGTLLRTFRSAKRSNGSTGALPDTWRDPYDPQNKLRNDYVSLEEQKTAQKGRSTPIIVHEV